MPLNVLLEGWWSRTEGPVHSPSWSLPRRWHPSHDYAAELRLVAGDRERAPRLIESTIKCSGCVGASLSVSNRCVSHPLQPPMWPRRTMLSSAVSFGLKREGWGWTISSHYQPKNGQTVSNGFVASVDSPDAYLNLRLYMSIPGVEYIN